MEGESEREDGLKNQVGYMDPYLNIFIYRNERVRFTLHLNVWQGQVVRRNVPIFRWYLRLDDRGKGKIRSFHLEADPTRYSPIGAIEEPRRERKWLDFEGTIPPRQLYNPNKESPAEMKIIDKGHVEYEVSVTEDDREIVDLVFHGKELTGKWRLIQEDPKSDHYFLQKVEEKFEKVVGRFIYQLHYGPQIPQHFDVRIDVGKPYLDEWSMQENPVEVGYTKAVLKKCEDKEWIKPFDGKKVVDGKTHFLMTLDSGEVNWIEDSMVFKSFIFKGKVLKGYWILKKEDDEWYFQKSKLPLAKIAPFKEPKIIDEEEYVKIEVYDLRDFSACEVDWKRYKEKLPFKVPDKVELNICSYPKYKTISHMRIQSIVFHKPDWDVDKAVRFFERFEDLIKEWDVPQIRG